MSFFGGGFQPVNGTFEATLNGLAIPPTVTAEYTALGRLVSIYFPAMDGVTDLAQISIGGIPASIFPAAELSIPCVVELESLTIQPAKLRFDVGSGEAVLAYFLFDSESDYGLTEDFTGVNEIAFIAQSISFLLPQ
jgi:hypothetical protein